MKRFNSVTKKLQCDDIDLADVCLLIDSVITDYSSTLDQLKPTIS
ncbi:hypothetical protein PF005_g5979 [Phytophthora fragariae]|nr:hypothetical protein PF009_g5964 [Phytophthora fragariae]KAE9043562.1 hypothetical protein PR002_g3279 [Phytophthora rubi]KAE9021381.1 hypothetical protein PF011_g4966 [Phytophthora fragariae]KAE9049518.1 hypothetical protein PR001_g3242 [Phytophthora rubi]KAE9126362.1 hypothetical protein PF010_g5290 [Phytophthora fragariae]